LYFCLIVLEVLEFLIGSQLRWLEALRLPQACAARINLIENSKKDEYFGENSELRVFARRTKLPFFNFTFHNLLE